MRPGRPPSPPRERHEGPSRCQSAACPAAPTPPPARSLLPCNAPSNPHRACPGFAPAPCSLTARGFHPLPQRRASAPGPPPPAGPPPRARRRPGAAAAGALRPALAAWHTTALRRRRSRGSRCRAGGAAAAGPVSHGWSPRPVSEWS